MIDYKNILDQIEQQWDNSLKEAEANKSVFEHALAALAEIKRQLEIAETACQMNQTSPPIMSQTLTTEDLETLEVLESRQKD